MRALPGMALRDGALCRQLPVSPAAPQVVYPHIRGGQKILSCVGTECMSGMLAKIGEQ